MDVDSLSPTQRDALAQLQALTNGGDAEVAIGVLSSVDWDVQRAAEIVFDGVPPPPPAPAARIEEFDIDDSEQGLLSGRRSGREFRQVESSSLSTIVIRPMRVVFNILAIPLYPLFSLLRFIFRALRIPLPNFGPFTLSYRPLGPGPSHEAKDPKSVAERWVLTLEEETGAVCISRSANRRREQGNGHSVATGVAGPSNLTVRSAWEEGSSGAAEGDLKLLPDFFLGGYEEFARTCQKDIKIGCIVIVSDEHDDVPEFKRSTLTDPSLLRVIQENDILVWGGDIRDREAWSASQKLQATTYPFVAFIALQPRRAPASSAPPAPTMTILSRHQGPSIPSTSAPTAAQTLVTHLNEHLLPRVNPFLAKLRSQAAERDRERKLREEQDRAFAESARKDAERIEKRRQEQRAAAEELQRAAEAEARAAAEQRKAEEAKKLWEAHRMEWRRWIRRGLVVREPRPGENGRGKTMRVGVRMPDGRRVVRFFGENDAVTALYAYVDSLFIPPEYGQDADPVAPPEGGWVGEAGLSGEMEQSGRTPEKWWGFKLVLAYPRREIPWEADKKVGEIDVLKGGGQVVVELIADEDGLKAKGKGKSAVETDDDDEYHTEESD
ncbi:hypothetical protein L226DRAFT_531309 [Lentinus tigrinus ALCF2SS1-7]|uniref:UBX domain-containing protein n=1 Tax=Lentinus tigrinus ALCF2SS1-6 TaxID=1328759 RepID=A0A5C2RZS2_9APHY|nr:hypothetical protein L227DRAFT_578756 [Lentinus tigrinus ALCF2SS1-6]RPD79540.1 hypothetical protein L226DRAFT_531309 [Lentinus tigrinus ALCF2SS1-7]